MDRIQKEDPSQLLTGCLHHKMLACEELARLVPAPFVGIVEPLTRITRPRCPGASDAPGPSLEGLLAGIERDIHDLPVGTAILTTLVGESG
jgi:hypothetical protein